MRSHRRRLQLPAGLAFAGLLATGLTGCAPVVTAAKVQATFASTFARLYVLQQSELGRHTVQVGHFFARTTCAKGSPGSSQTGAGDTWVCVEQWQQFDGYVASATYDVTVRTSGCLDAIGPANVVGGPQLSAPDGHAIVNPLAEFDACFQS